MSSHTETGKTTTYNLCAKLNENKPCCVFLKSELIGSQKCWWKLFAAGILLCYTEHRGSIRQFLSDAVMCELDMVLCTVYTNQQLLDLYPQQWL